MTVKQSTTRRDHSLEIAGLSLRYTLWGDPADEPVLLVHGLNSERHQWDPIAAPLGETFFVICPDLRGHGESSWAQDGYHLAQFVSDVRALVQELGLSPFHYVGHSLGARIGMAYGGEYAANLRSLTISDAGPELPPEAARIVRERQQTMANRRSFRDRDDALEFIQQLQPDWRPEFHRLYVTYSLRENWAGKLVQRSDPDLIWLTGSIGRADDQYLWQVTQNIDAPTLIVWGRRSNILDRNLVQQMLKAFPNPRLSEFDTGHYVPREAPEQFIDVVRDFLLSTDARRSTSLHEGIL